MNYPLSDDDSGRFGMTIISFSIKNWIPWINAESGISSSAHHPALFLIHAGMEISWDEADVDARTSMQTTRKKSMDFNLNHDRLAN